MEVKMFIDKIVNEEAELYNPDGSKLDLKIAVCDVV